MFSFFASKPIIYSSQNVFVFHGHMGKSQWTDRLARPLKTKRFIQVQWVGYRSFGCVMDWISFDFPSSDDSTVSVVLRYHAKQYCDT